MARAVSMRQDARALSAAAERLYRGGPRLFGLLQRYRPYICPFEDLIAEVPEGARVLDVGCGGGLFLGLLAATGRRPDAVGFDMSRPAVALAQDMAARHGHEHGAALRFERLDAQAPWPEGTFDVVSMIDVLHHIPPSAQEAAVRRAAQAVGPAGIFLYKDMGKRPRWRAAANRMHDLVLAREWIHYVEPTEVERWTAGEGLVLERSARINRLWYGHDLRVFRRPA